MHSFVSICLGSEFPVLPGDVDIRGMKVVLDTNVLIDGFEDDFSAQSKLIEAIIDDDLTAVITPAIEREYRKLLYKLIDDPEYKDRIGDFLAAAQVGEATFVEIDIDDEQDRKFLEAARGAEADMIVTKDRHLLDIGEIDTTRIVTPQEAWNTYQEEVKGDSGWQDFAKGIGIGK